MKAKLQLYDSLDMPVFFWNKIHQTNDLSWLMKKKQRITKAIAKKLSQVWDSMYQEYINEFGFSEQFAAIKAKEHEIAMLQMDLILTEDRTIETFIEIAMIELADMKKSGGKYGFLDSKIAIESKFKFQINLMQTSVREFYSYFKYLK
jgi:hypothetical protein